MWVRLGVMAFAGGLGAALANRGIVIFHDGLRPAVTELIQGRMSRGQLASIAFSTCFGLILVFGIPFTLASTLILSHALWLGTDMIGTRLPGPFDKNGSRKSSLGLLGSVVLGALYGILLVLGLQGFILLNARLPVNIHLSLEDIARPVIFTLAAYPALAIAYQYGLKHGLVAFLLTLIVWQVAGKLGLAQPAIWALLTGLVLLAVHAIQEGRCEPEPEEAFIIPIDQVKRIRSHLPWIAVLGATYALASNLGILMEGPQSLLALAGGDRLSAIHFTIARAISFLPLRTMSALTTGVFIMDGLGFAPTFGLVAPNAAAAAIAGGMVMCAEVYSLVWIARFFGRYPCFLNAANSIRTAMTKLLEVASLVGGMVAANQMSPGLGFFIAAGLYLLNEVAGTPVVRTAVGPVVVILVGITLNILALFQMT